LFLLAPVFLLGLLWWQSERIVSVLVDRIPPGAEAALGDLIFADKRRGLREIAKGDVTDTVRTIGRRLTANSAYDFRWHVVLDPAINAYAVPGGIVVVNSGLLLAADSAEEVAGVLAHEVQHIERRHSLKAIVHDLGLYALLRFALGDYGAGIVGKLARNLGALKFSREQESDADLRGLQTLQKAGISADGLLSFFQKLGAKGDKSIPLLSTHPASSDRLASIKSAAQASGPASSQPLNIDWRRIKDAAAAAQTAH
jgi:predicted Zn-dependent protease